MVLKTTISKVYQHINKLFTVGLFFHITVKKNNLFFCDIINYDRSGVLKLRVEKKLKKIYSISLIFLSTFRSRTCGIRYSRFSYLNRYRKNIFPKKATILLIRHYSPYKPYTLYPIPYTLYLIPNTLSHPPSIHNLAQLQPTIRFFFNLLDEFSNLLRPTD